MYGIYSANTIKKLPSQGMVEFHQHCIESFNKYWNKFDPKVYILAYFLHPAYRENEVHKMINESTFLQFEEKENEIDNRRNIPISEIPNHEVQVLIIEEMFNLKNAVKYLNNDGENSDDSDINDDVNKTDGEDKLDDSENEEMESNYDVKELIQQYLLDNELEGDTL
ncbi:hypothetical protein C1646_665833 [Rhizophagus diaphanus]|nr:hypothetical protein C1646_665833 [Rhizophagus diaphanus] [Rhizophagus sp. MUCL 43196]